MRNLLGKNMPARITEQQGGLGPARFILVFTAFTLLAYNGPMFVRAFGFLQGDNLGHNILLLGLLGMLVVFLQVVFFVLFALVSLRLMKLFAVLTLILNSAALYFILTYGTALNLNVIRSIFAADITTTANLLHPKLFMIVLVLGVLPAVVVMRLRVVRTPRWRLLGLIVAAFLGFINSAYLVSHRWPWDNWFSTEIASLITSEVGSMTLPWGYVINTVAYLQQDVFINHDLVLLPDGDFTQTLPAGQRQVVILVIGESARAANHSLYGYARETNPYTRDLDLVALPGAKSCGTYTLAGIACMLSHEGDQAQINSGQEALASYLQRQGVEVIWRTHLSNEPVPKVAEYVRLKDLREGCTNPNCGLANSESALLSGLEDRIIAADSSRVLVVLHQGFGSHGPAYYEQYPPEFERFTPVCETVQVQSCPRQNLINTYDNTMVHTDWFLAQIIDLLDAMADTQSVLIYASDHGESLGEVSQPESGRGYRLFQHAVAVGSAPPEQREIPILVWMSPDFQRARGLTSQEITQGGPFGHGNIFHSVLGAFDFKSPVYDQGKDIFVPSTAK